MNDSVLFSRAVNCICFTACTIAIFAFISLVAYCMGNSLRVPKRSIVNSSFPKFLVGNGLRL